MLDGLKPYPAYKESGVPWLGKVPEHWEIRQNRELFAVINDRHRSEEQMLSVTISRGVVCQRDLLHSGGKKDGSNEDKSNYKLVLPGDLVYNKMRAWQGAVGLSEFRGIVSPAYVVARPSPGKVPRYFHHLLRTPAFAKEAERWSYGITSDQWSLRPEHFRLIFSTLPPPEEQGVIVRFLEHADREIRRYLRARQQLVMLLEEQRGTICDRAVTRGLNSGIASKASGLPWLGNVPEQWDILSLRRRWEVVDCKHLTAPFVPVGAPLASVREAQTFDIELAKAKRTTQEYYEKLIGGGRAPRKGDVIYCRNVSVGASAFVGTDEPFAMGQDVCLIRSSTENCRFLNYVLHSPAMKRQLQNVLVGSTFDRINVAEVKNLTIAVPPRREQDEIVEHLDRTFAEIDAAIRSARRELVLVREFRERLVSDVITGRLDVRAAATALPEPDTGPDVLDDFGSAEDEVEGDADGVPVPDEADA